LCNKVDEKWTKCTPVTILFRPFNFTFFEVILCPVYPAKWYGYLRQVMANRFGPVKGTVAVSAL
jgi:hypothetical protein